MNDHQPTGDAFLGYRMRVLEEQQDRMTRILRRIDQKLDALGTTMTPEERAALVAKLNQEAKDIHTSADQLDQAAATLNTTAQGE